MKLSVSVPSLRLNSKQLPAEQFPFEVTNAIYLFYPHLYNFKFLSFHKWPAHQANYNFVSSCRRQDKSVFAIRSVPGAVATGSFIYNDQLTSSYPVATAPGTDLIATLIQGNETACRLLVAVFVLRNPDWSATVAVVLSGSTGKELQPRRLRSSPMLQSLKNNGR